MKLNTKNITYFILLILLTTFSLISCSDSDESEEIKTKVIDEPALKKEAKLLEQFADYTDSSKLVKISIRDYGYIYVKLFPEYAPVTVERFLSLVKDNYYDGVSLCRVIDNYLIQSGSNTDYDEPDKIADEFTMKLHPYRGALCMANEGTKDSNGTEFMIIQGNADFMDRLSDLVEYKGYTLSEYLHAAYGTNLSDVQLNSYMIYSGAPWLYGHHTVFGQMYEGYDVLDSIAKAEIDDDYMPIKDIIIDDITIIQ